MAPKARELSEADQITVNNGGTLAPTAAPVGIVAQAQAAQALAQVGVAPPPPPEANLAYKKSGEAGGGVIAMIAGCLTASFSWLDHIWLIDPVGTNSLSARLGQLPTTLCAPLDVHFR